MINGTNNYQYIKVQSLYVCINNNLFFTFVYLLFRSKPFHLSGPTELPFIKFFPKEIIKIIRVIDIIINVLLYKKFNYIKNVKSLLVPYNGHLLIKTANGYKVFNLSQKVVITQYNSDVKTDTFNKLVTNFNLLRNYNIAPEIYKVDYKNKSIYEEYCNLHRAKRFYPISTYFHTTILPIWDRNINTFPLKVVNLTDYVRNLKKQIYIRINYIENSGHSDELLSNIRNYADNLSTDILTNYKVETIETTITHGDLHAWNILINKNNIKIIDWDTLEIRSLFHDIYYMFYHNIFSKKNSDLNVFSSELIECFENITNKYIDPKYEKNNSTIENINLYRKLFYLEYIYLNFDKKISMYNSKKYAINILKNINSNITIFKEVEIIIAQLNESEKVFVNSYSLP